MSVAGYGAGRVPSEAEVLDVVRAAVARVLDLEVASVGEATPLGPAHGLDSLACVEVVDLVEQAVGTLSGRPVTVDDEVVAGLRTVGEMVAHVAARVEGGRG